MSQKRNSNSNSKYLPSIYCVPKIVQSVPYMRECEKVYVLIQQLLNEKDIIIDLVLWRDETKTQKG